MAEDFVGYLASENKWMGQLNRWNHIQNVPK
jgi:hypothetical protein